MKSSPVAVLAGLRANEARYFRNKYKTELVGSPAAENQKRVAWVRKTELCASLEVPSPLQFINFTVWQ